MDGFEDGKTLPSAVKSELKFCSNKLEYVTTIDEFEDIMNNYRLLEDKLNRAGMLRGDFANIINDMKKEL